MSIESFALWLSETPLSMALTDSEWAFPALESLHVIALALVVGSIGVVDLRLLGVASKQRDPAHLIRAILPLTWVAFAAALATGLLLFSANPISYASNFYFLAKLGLLGVAGINMVLFHAFAHRHLATPGALAPRVSGGVSLALWVTIVTCGRWIGFTL
ncbi:MAG: DUF6644 family protein [Novosphingobium sp.]